jgi:hypothetical protein
MMTNKSGWSRRRLLQSAAMSPVLSGMGSAAHASSDKATTPRRVSTMSWAFAR